MFPTDFAIVTILASRTAPVAKPRSNPPNFAASSTLFGKFAAGSVSLQLGRYKSRLAMTDADKEATGRLRFNVFNEELGEGLIESYATGRDYDCFEPAEDHLIVEDTELSVIVGTYRMQSGPVASANFGYYSQREF